MGGRARQHLARQGCGLQPRGGVHDGARYEQLAGWTDAGRGFARLDADPDLELLLQSCFRREPSCPPADGEAGSNRAQRVVLVDLGQAEDRHHGVADELLRAAAQRLKLLGRSVEEGPEQLTRPLGVEPPRQGRRVHDVGEEDGDHLPFLGAEHAPDRGATAGAETSPRRQRAAADGTDH